jgi:hypothetical protein
MPKLIFRVIDDIEVEVTDEELAFLKANDEAVDAEWPDDELCCMLEMRDTQSCHREVQSWKEA